MKARSDFYTLSQDYITNTIASVASRGVKSLHSELAFENLFECKHDAGFY